MKELIDKLSLGIIEYTKPVMEVSVDEISLSMEAEKVHEGSFKIVSANELPLKGIIFSTDNRLTIENNQFIGIDNVINYKVNTAYVNGGEEIKGNINIISNGGEISIPFVINIVSVSADTTTGSVKNLFHFANLVQMSYDEAVKLFKSPSFAHIFLEKDLPLMAVYNGLVGSLDVNVAMEEFLVAANKKSQVNISLSKEKEEYSNIEENYGDAITVKKNTWGYVNIEVYVEGDFIHVDRKSLTGNDFAANKYEFSYYIKKEKLHQGKNEGRIRFKTFHQTVDYEICVMMETSKADSTKEVKSAVYTVMNNYLKFRMHRMELNEWVEVSNAIISRARGIADSMMLKLLQAHIYITKGDESDAQWMLENVAKDLLPEKDRHVELYCYYLYLGTLQKRDESFTAEVISIIKNYYENGYDSWRILWILLYIDEVYDNNISIRLLRIKDRYMSGMRSPLLYFEALLCFNEVPEMLRVLDEFEVQVLNFGIKNKFINKKLALQVNEISRTEKRINSILFNVIAELYEKYHEDEILENICTMLIKHNKTDEKYFYWFEKCIEKGMKITSLYEYYMYTISDDFEEMLPQIVMMYFVYNSKSLPDEKVDLLYANIIQNKEKIPNIYNSYKPQFEKYVADSVMNGRMNRNLAVVYKDIFTKAMIAKEMADELAGILNTYEIRPDAPNIREVIIVHKEMDDIKKYPVKNGISYVRIYTEDVAVVFEDMKGNRYCRTINYEKERLLDMEENLRLCYEMSEENEMLTLYFADKYLKYKKNPDKSIEILKSIVKIEELVGSFHNMIEKEIVDYYSNNYDGESLDEYLMKVDADRLGTAARVKIIEMTVVRGLYDRAYELMSKFGFYEVEPRRVVKCVAKLLEARQSEKDNLLIEMASFAFSKGKYNEELLNYLGRYYDSTTKLLLAIWKAAKDFECENRELEERIIVQMLFSGAYVGKIDEIYESYQRKGANSKVKKAYFFSKSYDYFVKERVIDENIFKHIERDADNGEEVNDVCALAYLKYMSQYKKLTDEQINICETLVYELAKVNKVFEFFKNFKKHFRLPYDIMDKTIVEYRTNPDSKVLIHYRMEENDLSDGKYKIQPMADVSCGVFTYPVVLFYGENIQYYITEELNGEVMVTESSTLKLSDVEFSNDNTHYGMLNDILVCKDMKEEKTLEKMASDYILKKELMSTIFEIKK